MVKWMVTAQDGHNKIAEILSSDWPLIHTPSILKTQNFEFVGYLIRPFSTWGNRLPHSYITIPQIGAERVLIKPFFFLAWQREESFSRLWLGIAVFPGSVHKSLELQSYEIKGEYLKEPVRLSTRAHAGTHAYIQSRIYSLIHTHTSSHTNIITHLYTYKQSQI